MTHVQITSPAPDQNGTSILIDGVEMRERIAAGSVQIEFRQPPLKPLVTVGIFAPDLALDIDADVTVNANTEALLRAAGWRPAYAEGGIVR
jgi:hypothetical protein